MSSYNPVDSKLLIRVDFRPTLIYFDQMFKLASSLEGEFEHWQAAYNPSMGMLFDSASKKQLDITSQLISFTTKNGALLKDPYSEVSRLLVLFLSGSDVSVIRRIGVRLRGIKHVNKTYSEFTDKFFESFYESKKELKDLAADKLDDVVVVLQGIKDGFQNRLQFGPLKQEQLENLYGVERFETIEDIKLGQKTAVMVDTDIFSLSETDLDEALSNLKEAISINEKMYKATWDLIQEKI